MDKNFESYKAKFAENGYEVIENIYKEDEIAQILASIETVESHNKDTFRKSSDLFAIRQFFKEVPACISLIFNENLKNLIEKVLGNDYFVVKSIYFDKPETSNWFVSYHQDLTISVDKKVDIADFKGWTVKQNQFAVQPNLDYLENIATIRIHLDSTNADNGALNVIPKSHLKQIYDPRTIDWAVEKVVSCSVNRGGVMLMKPLTLHSSSRTVNNQRRRVVHIEFASKELPKELNWAERLDIKIGQ